MKKLHCLTLILFLFFLGTGILLSSSKLLWNDELYTQSSNIEVYSLTNFLLGQTREGNLCPLFYIPQKLFLNTLNYKLPFQWKEDPSVYEPRSQILLRIPAVIYMALALSLIFYTFTHFYSIKTGCLALGFSLSSPMVWMYWAEARPYGLWFLLTIVQAFLLLKFLHKKESHPWIGIGACHILLSLTIIFSLPQILIVTFAIWMFQKKDWKKALLNLILPLLFCYFYYAQAKKVYGWMPSGAGGDAQFLVQQFLNVSLPQVHYWFMHFIPMNILWIWLVPFIIYLVITKSKLACKEPLVFILSTLGLTLSSCLILSVFSAWSSLGINYAVSDRYFIFLGPYALFSLTLSYVHLKRLIHDPFLQILINMLYIGTVLVGSLQTLNYMTYWGIF